MSGWIGVDFDGTLSEYHGWQGIDHVGPPIKKMCDKVREWLDNDREVRIFTARVFGSSGADLVAIEKPIRQFCREQFNQELRITCVKDFGMIELYDDRAYHVKHNEGEIVYG